MGHDLELEDTDFVLSFSAADGRVSGTFQADSLRVAGVVASDGVEAVEVSPADKMTIERHIRDDVLCSREFPTIAFLAEGLRFDAGAEVVAGKLELCGARRDVAVRTRLADGRWIAQATVHQPDFGMVPFRTMLGGLRVHVDVEVEITVPAERLSDIGAPS